MPLWLIALYCLHVVAALFWLGSSFLTAQAKGRGAERQFPLEMIAATITVLVGGYLWSRLHGAGFGRMELVLAIGVAFAIAAAGVQGALVGGSLRKLRTGALDEIAARKRITAGERIGAGLLAMALLCMVGSYHVGA